MIAPIRSVDGREFPIAGTWVIDNTHSAIEFSISHMVVSRVRGRIKTFSGEVLVDDDPCRSSVDVTMDARSIDTGAIDELRADGTVANRDVDLRSARFLDIKRHPSIRFRSTSFVPAADVRAWTLIGELAIRGVSRAIRLDVEFVDAIAYRVAGGRTMETAVFTARAQLDRGDFGITTNWRMLEFGGWVIGKTLDVEIQLSARRVGPDRAD